MGSLRDFVSSKLKPAIIKDTKEYRIFNERDLHVRSAYHIQKKFVGRGYPLFLRNEPSMRIGHGRGTISVKPDIVVYDDKGPLGVFEFKCHLDDADKKLQPIADGISDDIDKLQKFTQRFGHVEYAFAITLTNLAEQDQFKNLERCLKRRHESWMKHRFKLHLINMRSEIRRNYDEWLEQWYEVRDTVSVSGITSFE